MQTFNATNWRSEMNLRGASNPSTGKNVTFCNVISLSSQDPQPIIHPEAAYSTPKRVSGLSQASPWCVRSFTARSLVLCVFLLLAAVGARAQTVFSNLQAVGTTSSAQSVTVTVTWPSGGTVSKVEVLTEGASGPKLDFEKGAGASTCESLPTEPHAPSG